MDFSKNMDKFFEGCTTECSNCTYVKNKECFHPQNPANVNRHLNSIILGTFSRYVGGTYTQKDKYLVVYHQGKNIVTGNKTFNSNF